MAALGEGRVFQLNVSAGGVPKRAVSRAMCRTLGLDGDDHNDKEEHGGPERAPCLYALEHYLTLQAEGHPAFPGSVGENVTLYGIELGSLEPGDRLTFGEGAEVVEIEITSYTMPCKNIAGSFSDGIFTRISQKVYPGTSRLYARVLHGGELRVGQRVTAGRN